MRSMLIRPTLLALATVAVTACQDQTAEPPPVAVQQAPTAPAEPAPPPATAEPAPETPAPMRNLASSDAPFACELLDGDAAGEALGRAVTVKDITAVRKADVAAAVESSCLYVLGSGDDPLQASLRVEVWTEASLQSAGWGGLDKAWSSRAHSHSKPFVGLPEAWAAWVESDHPPDQSLLVRQGEVMLELTSYPPVSGDQPWVPNHVVENFARRALEAAAARVDAATESPSTQP